MAELRSSPYIWATWLTKLLVGEDSCKWAAWFRAHYQNYGRVPSTFDQAAWQMDHTVLLNETQANLEIEGYTVRTESQNSFKLQGSSGATLAGKPDFIATKAASGVIQDIKTGQPKTSDQVQTMIYMWAAPLALRQYGGITFDGKVVYRDHEVPIPAGAVNETFQNNLFELLRQIGGSQPLRRVPSPKECSFCPIAESECPERIVGPGPNDEMQVVPGF